MEAVLSSRPLPSSSEVHGITALVLTEVARRLDRSSRWNGQLYLLRRPRAASAAAMPDGRLAVNRDDVLRPFEDALMARRRRRRLSPGLADRLRDAFDTLVHEGCHLAAPPHAVGSAGTDEAVGVAVEPLEAAASVSDHVAASALQEGLVRLWTERNLDAVLTGVGLDSMFPEVRQVPLRADGPRPGLLRLGAQAVVSELSRVSGHRGDDVLHRLVTAGPGEAWASAADLVLEGWPENALPASAVPGVRSRLFEVGRSAYAGVVVAYLTSARTRDAAAQVTSAGRDAVRAIVRAGDSERRASAGTDGRLLAALPGGRTDAATAGSRARSEAAVRAALTGQVPLIAGSGAIAIDPCPPPVVAPPATPRRPGREDPAPGR